MRKHKSLNTQKGVTLLEIMVALFILGSVFAGVGMMIDQSSSRTTAALAGQQLRLVGDAAQSYIKDNYAAVTGTATATTPVLIRVSDLVAGNYLNAGFQVANGYQQNQCILVLEPTANNLTALVVTEGGKTVDDVSLGDVVGSIGAEGGALYTSAPTTIRGTMGGYSLAIGNFANANHLGQKCDGTAGVVSIAVGHPVMALWFSNGDANSAYLYRNAVGGQPQLNRMNTAIDMNNNSINNASTVQLTTQVNSGDACPTNGVMATNATGQVMSCQNLQWKTQGSLYWQDPVTTKTALDALPCNASTLNQTRVVQLRNDSSARPSAYTCNGSSWQPLGVDAAGNITVTGTATVGKMQVNDVVTEGAACSPNGLVARDATGLLLSCQSGSWRKAMTTTCGGSPIGTLRNYVWNGSYYSYQICRSDGTWQSFADNVI